MTRKKTTPKAVSDKALDSVTAAGIVFVGGWGSSYGVANPGAGAKTVGAPSATPGR